MDTADHLNQKIYRIRIRYIDTISKAYLENVGILTHNQEMTPEEIQGLEDLILQYASVFDMGNYRTQGIAFTIPSREDVYDIYTRINNHLKAWADYLNTLRHSVNRVTYVPVQDLCTLYDFAQELKPVIESKLNKLDPYNTGNAIADYFNRRSGVVAFTARPGESLFEVNFKEEDVVLEDIVNNKALSPTSFLPKVEHKSTDNREINEDGTEVITVANQWGF